MSRESAPPLSALPIVGRQWRTITLGEYASWLSQRSFAAPPLSSTEGDRRLIGFLVESWLEEWWTKNSQG